MAASEKREYKSEAIAKRQLVQWQKKGCRVTRRKNALYIQKTWRKGKGGVMTYLICPTEAETIS